VTILSPPDEMNWSTARVRNIRVSFELMLTPMTKNLANGKIHHADILTKCAELSDNGKLKIKIDKIFPFESAPKAHEYVENQNTIGKVVLEI